MVEVVTVVLVFQAVFAGVLALFAWASWRQTRVIASANDSLATIQEQGFQFQITAFALAAADVVKRQALEEGRAQLALDIDEKMSAIFLLDFAESEDLQDRYDGAVNALIQSYLKAAQELYREAKAEKFAAAEALDVKNGPQDQNT